MRRALITGLCIIVLLTSAAAAHAASLAITPPLGAQSEDSPFAIQISGDTNGLTDGDGRVEVRGRPGGGAACAPTSDADSGSLIEYGVIAEGAFSFTRTANANDPGTYQLCAWLMDDSASNTIQVAQVVVPIRVPNLALTLTVPSGRIAPGRAIPVGISWSAEVERRLHVLLVDSPNCAQSDASVRTLAAHYISVLDRDVSGAGSQPQTATPGESGTYLVCGYLEQSSSEVAQLVAQAPNPVIVASPPITRSCGDVGGRRHIRRVRARVLRCTTARSVARRWGRARHAPGKVSGLRCRARRSTVTCTGARERKVTFLYRHG